MSLLYYIASNNKKGFKLEFLTRGLYLEFDDVNKVPFPNNLTFDVVLKQNDAVIKHLFRRYVNLRNKIEWGTVNAVTNRGRYSWWLGPSTDDRASTGYMVSFPINQRILIESSDASENLLFSTNQVVVGTIRPTVMAGNPESGYTNTPNINTLLLSNYLVEVFEIKADNHSFKFNEGAGDTITAEDGTILKIKKNGTTPIEGVDYKWTQI